MRIPVCASCNTALWDWTTWVPAVWWRRLAGRVVLNKQRSPARPLPLSHLESESRICGEKRARRPCQSLLGWQVPTCPTSAHPKVPATPQAWPCSVLLHNPFRFPRTRCPHAWGPAKRPSSPEGKSEHCWPQPEHEPAPAFVHYPPPQQLPALGFTHHFIHALMPATPGDSRRCPPHPRAHAPVRWFCLSQTTNQPGNPTPDPMEKTKEKEINYSRGQISSMW